MCIGNLFWVPLTLTPSRWPNFTFLVCFFHLSPVNVCTIQHERVICLSLISSSHPANLSSGLLASLLRIRQHLILALVHWLRLCLFVDAGVCVNLHRQTGEVSSNFVLVIQLRNYVIIWLKWLLKRYKMKKHILFHSCSFCWVSAVHQKLFSYLQYVFSPSAVSFLCPLHSWTTGEEMAKDILQHRYHLTVKH